MERINPALPDVEWRHLLKAQRRVSGAIARVVADSPAPAPVVAPTDPVLLSIDLDTDGTTIVYTYSADPGTPDVSVPVSTLMVPDPSDGVTWTFPTLPYWS